MLNKCEALFIFLLHEASQLFSAHKIMDYELSRGFACDLHISWNATHFLYNECLPKVDISICHLPLATLPLRQKPNTEGGWEPEVGGQAPLLGVPGSSQGERCVAFRISAVKMFNDYFLFSQRDLSFLAAQQEWLPWVVFTTEVSGASLVSTRYPSL